jgi:hypothetical protein
VGTETVINRVKHNLLDALDIMRADLDRVELLAAALSVFSRPIPDYEPRFRHLHRVPLSAHELGETAARKP